MGFLSNIEFWLERKQTELGRILHLKPEIRNLKLDLIVLRVVPRVQFEILLFRFLKSPFVQFRNVSRMGQVS